MPSFFISNHLQSRQAYDAGLDGKSCVVYSNQSEVHLFVFIYEQVLDWNLSAVSMATYRIPEGELSLAHAAKTSGEHFSVR